MDNFYYTSPSELKAVTLKEGFFKEYTKLVQEVVIPYQWEALNDRIPEAEKSHAINNFRIAAGEAEGEFEGLVFQDSDLAKWLEAVGYSLASKPDSQLEAWADEVIELIEKAQQKDGYLNTFFTLKRPGERWTNLLECHELYCAGHMMEAAVAYYEATGKRKLLEVMCRFADHIDSVFGTEEGKLHGYDGHEEVELALVKLYKVTGNEKYLNLSRYFIDERGQEPSFFIEEWEKRGRVPFWNVYEDRKPELSYYQAHIPVREQTEAVGHAVRAVYLYAGMADIAALTKDEELKQSCRRLWDNIVTRQMYITGGIGSTHSGEAFTFNFDLPNDTVYQETCASIGLFFFAHRMLLMEKDSSFADVMEKALYNSIISGMGFDGKSFFYVNPMEVWPEASAKNPERRHVMPVRQKWYGCACCPPNLARLIVSLKQYIYTYNNEALYTHLYIPSKTEVLTGEDVFTLEQSTAYPWNGDIRIITEFKKARNYTLAFRIPGWCRQVKITVNGENYPLEGNVAGGYVSVTRRWKEQEEIRISFEMPVELIQSHPEVRANAGKVALQRGPLVYCLEEADNGENLSALSIDTESEFEIKKEPDLMKGALSVTGKGVRIPDDKWENSLYQPYKKQEKDVVIKAIPYFLWGNRKSGEMLVWMNHK
ncbi:glycoside hydrolase family 127 protein [Anaerocolumna sp. AGMB13020]|uniref:glycoside hydrolase family 127 protein n=1 Tax=Anaerocolumna sp. AGMB13020 TaxID=3081750 RepID=UPI002955AAE7|nr:beta-L-arabinofuranosidase domain-containing protein [Anaerocolumna sp. AGMB13020]WOO35301.1 glycoside hydrolase family 127 protein [Anaerocolumna sp. AGMB13020]